MLGRYQGFTFLGLLNTWIPLPVRWFSGVTARWWGQASSMLGVGPHPFSLDPATFYSHFPVFEPLSRVILQGRGALLTLSQSE